MPPKKKLKIAEDGSGEDTDPLCLEPLFKGGGEDWYVLLKDVIEEQEEASSFIGPDRSRSIVPVRELTFQAIKPNPPAHWNVVIFGQSPYPRQESATGIAMFDATLKSWNDRRFGQINSMRCIIRAAMNSKFKTGCDMPVKDMRIFLKHNKAVGPKEWFKSILMQGCLLLNAALTIDGGKKPNLGAHTTFWRPIIFAIVEEILKAKQVVKEQQYQGLVFAWWGAKALSIKRQLSEMLEETYTDVKIRHVVHCNPAATGDGFSWGDHFGKINEELKKLKLKTIDWLPTAYDKEKNTRMKKKSRKEDTHECVYENTFQYLVAQRMSEFIDSTIELHNSYLERLGDLEHEIKSKITLDPIFGILTTRKSKNPRKRLRKRVEVIKDLETGCQALLARIENLATRINNALVFAKEILRTDEDSRMKGTGKTAITVRNNSKEKGNRGTQDEKTLTINEIAALNLYTQECKLYKILNEDLRDPKRAKIKDFFGYLQLLLTALRKLPKNEGLLYRGVNLDLSKKYSKGNRVTWWGVSSCTKDVAIAKRFLGKSGKRTLFEVSTNNAVNIKKYSCYQEEDEHLIAPGTQFVVKKVKKDRGNGIVTICVQELQEKPLVC